MAMIELVIFDCDGVLVDSERLAVRLEAAILAELGWPLSIEEVVERFVGRSAAYMRAAVEQHLGRKIDWDVVFEQRYDDAFDKELVAVDGVAEAISRIEARTCVASSASHERIRRSLGTTGLLSRFDGRIFSASDVARGKPAPDLFLHAAERMGVDPRACIVVEDSPAGVDAANAAGMAVLAYARSVAPASALRRPGATLFDDMRDLPALVRSWSDDG